MEIIHKKIGRTYKFQIEKTSSIVAYLYLQRVPFPKTVIPSLSLVSGAKQQKKTLGVFLSGYGIWAMSGDRVSVEVCKGINGLEKVVLREARGSSAEVTIPFSI